MKKRITHWIAGIIFLLVPMMGPAQDTNTTADAVDQVTAVSDALTKTEAPVDLEDPGLTLKQLVEQGGFLIYLLMAMSVGGVALVAMFFFTLNSSRVAPGQFVQDLLVMMRHGRYEEARKRCERNNSPAAAIGIAALDYITVAVEPDPEMLHEVIEGEGVRQASRLQTQINYLLDIGVIAPMVGLLGTVMGMLKAFNSIALDIAKAAPVELAYGVSQALVTTAAGLFVAIPAMIFYAYFRGRVATLTANLELVATEFVTTLVHRKSV